MYKCTPRELDTVLNLIQHHNQLKQKQNHSDYEIGLIQY